MSTVPKDTNFLNNRRLNVRGEIKEFQQGPPVAAPIAIRVISENLNLVSSFAEKVEECILEEQGTVNVRNNSRHTRIDLQVNLHREKAALVGVHPYSADMAVRAALTGLPAGEYRDSLGEKYPVTVKVGGKSPSRIEDLERVSAPSISGRMVA